MMRRFGGPGEGLGDDDLWYVLLHREFTLAFYQNSVMAYFRE
jgi:hypothetical protein